MHTDWKTHMQINIETNEIINRYQKLNKGIFEYID